MYVYNFLVHSGFYKEIINLNDDMKSLIADFCMFYKCMQTRLKKQNKLKMAQDQLCANRNSQKKFLNFF